jgi:hypothetical protein
MNALVDKVQIPDKPIGDQLSPSDSARFSEIRQRMATMQIASLIESRRERDLRVIQHLTQIADMNYRWQQSIDDEKDPQYILQQVLSLWRITENGHKQKIRVTEPDVTKCSLVYALHRVEEEPLRKLSRMDLTQASATFEKLAARYGRPIDRDKLAEGDRNAFDDVMNNVMQPAARERKFIHDMEYIKIMARASAILYDANSREVAFGGGSTEAIGVTIQDKIKAKEYDDLTIFAFGVWRIVNEKVPADILKDWEKLGETRGSATK